jgi:predicted DNA-binding protein (UPF0251 family)
MALAVRLVLAGVPQRTAAKQMGVSRMTWWRYRQRADFTTALLVEMKRREVLAA